MYCVDLHMWIDFEVMDECTWDCWCRNAAGILVVYDMTERASFERAIRWLTELPSTMPADTVLILVGVNSFLANAAMLNASASCARSHYGNDDVSRCIVWFLFCSKQE